MHVLRSLHHLFDSHAFRRTATPSLVALTLLWVASLVAVVVTHDPEVDAFFLYVSALLLLNVVLMVAYCLYRQHGEDLYHETGEERFRNTLDHLQDSVLAHEEAIAELQIVTKISGKSLEIVLQHFERALEVVKKDEERRARRRTRYAEKKQAFSKNEEKETDEYDDEENELSLGTPATLRSDNNPPPYSGYISVTTSDPLPTLNTNYTSFSSSPPYPFSAPSTMTSSSSFVHTFSPTQEQNAPVEEQDPLDEDSHTLQVLFEPVHVTIEGHTPPNEDFSIQEHQQDLNAQAQRPEADGGREHAAFDEE